MNITNNYNISKNDLQVLCIKEFQVFSSQAFLAIEATQATGLSQPYLPAYKAADTGRGKFVIGLM